METTRKLMPCYVLVVTASATTSIGALRYRPFGDKSQSLRDIFASAATNAKNGGVLRDLSYDYYDVSEAFFFGADVTDEVVAKLRDVPSAIVDCDVFSIETPAVIDVRTAIAAFNKKAGKILYKIIANGRCQDGEHSGLPITSEAKLLSVLEAHLWSHKFAMVAEGHP
jgi:hypothetical protein